ncbi:MAG TPA: hypothetical protein VKG05_15695 [Steroidobacteraceae bacterium]|nr:hypothetical protein [Steroidobacteraceae bacterium]
MLGRLPDPRALPAERMRLEGRLMIETLSLIAFILAIAFVAFAAPKRTDDKPKRPPESTDENKKDSDSAGNSPDK